jgi:hypothetical protein
MRKKNIIFGMRAMTASFLLAVEGRGRPLEVVPSGVVHPPMRNETIHNDTVTVQALT